MNMMIAELLAFDVALADASLHIELSKDEHTQYSTLSSSRGPTSSCSTQGRPMESGDPTRGEAGVGVSNTEEGRSTAHSCVLKGLVQSMGPSRCEDMAGTTRSFRWTRVTRWTERSQHTRIQKNVHTEDGRIRVVAEFRSEGNWI
ncbi:BQ5605_C031g10976 [Microbotryum silenes-dioicae]|uniref:BQ5605_C031g10976 protein n=1 Tax=Microbotryum silenes-dioicae TaxID=796604 RepID=A0A2X0PC22_9BASI|nr:BQ5605_C031g10976 [Microbotryum silenes-dioicae]